MPAGAIVARATGSPNSEMFEINAGTPHTEDSMAKQGLSKRAVAGFKNGTFTHCVSALHVHECCLQNCVLVFPCSIAFSKLGPVQTIPIARDPADT